MSGSKSGTPLGWALKGMLDPTHEGRFASGAHGEWVKVAMAVFPFYRYTNLHLNSVALIPENEVTDSRIRDRRRASTYQILGGAYHEPHPLASQVSMCPPSPLGELPQAPLAQHS